MLADFQKIILACYTNRAFRETLYANPEKLFMQFSLSSKEKNALLKLDRNRVEMFARSLSGKKKTIAEKLLSKNPESVILSEYRYAGPAMFFRTHQKMMYLDISDEIYRICAQLHGSIEFWNILRLVFRIPDLRLKNFISFLYTVFIYELSGKKIIFI